MKNLYLLENIDYSNLKKKINTQDSEIITFDYFSHNILSAHQIKHRKMDEYLEEQDREKFFRLATSLWEWYKILDEKNFTFHNINLLSIIDRNELHEFLMNLHPFCPPRTSPGGLQIQGSAKVFSPDFIYKTFF